MTNWTNRIPPNTTWTNRIPPNTTWGSDRIESFLLTEVFGFLLQEDGGKIKLDGFGIPTTNWVSRPLIS